MRLPVLGLGRGSGLLRNTLAVGTRARGARKPVRRVSSDLRRNTCPRQLSHLGKGVELIRWSLRSGRIDEAIETWFTDLQAYEAQLDALASASMDQNFTDELQAIESCESEFLDT